MRWEAVEGSPGVVFADAAVACTRATFPDDRVYAVPMPAIGSEKPRMTDLIGQCVA